MSDVEGSASRQRAQRKFRLFIGVAICDEIRKECAEIAERLRARQPNLRFVEPENYHLTLAFLGNVDAQRVPEVEAALAAVASHHEHLEVTLNRVGAFPHERTPRIIFIGSRGADRRYRALAASVRAACTHLGFTVDEKDDIPHVTIARTSDRRRATLPLIEVAPISVHVTDLTLFESVPYEERTQYVTLARSRLRSSLGGEGRVSEA